MIIDAHTHLFEAYVTQRGVPVGEFVDSLQAHGISKALAFTTEGFFGNQKQWNDALAELTRPYPRILYSCATVDPRAGKLAIDELRRCVTQLGMVGLKLHPWLQAFSVLDPLLYPIIETAIDLHIPVIFHDGTPPYCTPLQIAHLAQQYPEATIVLGHSGLSDFPREALAALKRCPNLVACPCGAPMSAITRYVEAIGAERVIFGSDFPWGGPESLEYYKLKIDRLPVSEDERKLIFSGSVLRIIPALAD